MGDELVQKIGIGLAYSSQWLGAQRISLNVTNNPSDAKAVWDSHSPDEVKLLCREIESKILALSKLI